MSNTIASKSSSNFLNRAIKGINSYRSASNTRSVLLGLNDHLLKDIGMSRNDAFYGGNN